MNSQLSVKIQKKMLVRGEPLYSTNEARSMVSTQLHSNDLASYKHVVQTKFERRNTVHSNQGRLIRYSRWAPKYGKCRLHWTDKIRK